MEYRLTEKGRTSDIPHPAGRQILDFMKEGHGVVNPSEVELELSMDSAQAALDKLVKAGYLSKEEEEAETEFGIF